MLKRCVCLILTICITVCALPAKAITEYSVLFNILSENYDLEMAFREWAHEKLSTYMMEYLKPFPNQYTEYYHLASYKGWFDMTFGEEKNNFGEVRRSIENTAPTMTDDDWVQFYLEVLLDSLERMKTVDPSYIEKYLSMSGEEKRVYTLSVDGTWEESTFLEESDNIAAYNAINEAAALAVDFADLVVTTTIEYQSVKSGASSSPDKKSLNDDIKFINEVVASVAKNAAETLTNNFKTKAENKIKRYLQQKAVNTLHNAMAADVAYLKSVYISDESVDINIRRAASRIVTYYESQQAKTRMIEEGEKAIAQAEIDNFGLELQPVLKGLDVFLVVIADGLKTAIVKAITDSAKKNAEENAFTYPVVTLFDKVIDICFENIKENWTENGFNGVDTLLSAFNFSDADVADIMKELNSLDIITDAVPMKEIGQTMEENNWSWSKRFTYILTYYITLKLPEAALDDYVFNDDYIDNLKAELEGNPEKIEQTQEPFPEGARELVSSFVSDVFKYVVPSIIDDSISSIKIDLQNLSKEDKGTLIGALEEQIKNVDLEFVQNTAEIITSIADKAWNVGKDINKTYNATKDAATGEAGINGLAQEVVAARNLTEQLHNKGLDVNLPHVLDKDEMTAQEVYRCIEEMKAAINGDKAGINAYYNVALQGRNERSNTDFMKILNGDGVFRYNVFHPIKETGWITKEYINVSGGIGLLDEKAALDYRNGFTKWTDWLDIGWQEEWRVFE